MPTKLSNSSRKASSCPAFNLNLTTLKAVKKGDYTLKVALATDDRTIVATAGVALSVGPAAPAATPVPAATAPASTTTTPATLPKTGASASLSPLPGIALVLVLFGIMTLSLGRIVRRAQ